VQKLASDLDRGKLDATTSEVGLAKAIEVASALLGGKVKGRVVGQRQRVAGQADAEMPAARRS